jgi:hypothetical protein
VKWIKGVLYKVGTGEPVDLLLHHMIVFGVTEFSGKTTVIESAIAASGYRGLVFRAKRGELGFEGAKRIPIFFDDRGIVTWRNLIGLMNTMFDSHVERIPGMEYAIQQICMEPTQAKTLKEIADRADSRLTVEKAGKKAGGFMEGVFGRFVNYLKEILPELEKINPTNRLEMGEEGLYAMDLTGLSDAVKNLIIASVLNKVYHDVSNVIVVIPEVKKYIPAGLGTPVKWVANLILSEGRSVGDYMWLDTQNMKGIDKEPPRNISVRLFGVQPDPYEIRELLKALPLGENGPTEKEMMTLEMGQFWAKIRSTFVKVYARPVWLPEGLAIKVAKGEVAADSDEVQSFKNVYKLEEPPIFTDAHLVSKMREERIATEEDWSEFEPRLRALEEGAA